MSDRFYVYEHRRKDTGAIFYVGKGTGWRCKSKQGRNKYWINVAQRAGYDISILHFGLDEDLAFLVESERIDQLRRLGVKLCNVTDGGGGISGYKRPPEVNEKIMAKQRGQKRPSVSLALKGIPKSAEHREKLSLSRTGLKISDEARRRLSEKRKGSVGFFLGWKHKEESKEKIRLSVATAYQDGTVSKKISESLKVKYSDPAHKEMVRAATIKAISNPDVRKKMSESHKGEKNWIYGRKIPEEQKARQIAALKARPRVTCPHCNKTMDEANAKRWHMNNCNKRAI
jgi:hypothetical protein